MLNSRWWIIRRWLMKWRHRRRCLPSPCHGSARPWLLLARRRGGVGVGAHKGRRHFQSIKILNFTGSLARLCKFVKAQHAFFCPSASARVRACVCLLNLCDKCSRMTKLGPSTRIHKQDAKRYMWCWFVCAASKRQKPPARKEGVGGW